METRTCKACEATKPIDQFDRKRISNAGVAYYRNQCKPCYNAIRRNAYASTPEMRRKKCVAAARWRQEHPEEYAASRKRYQDTNGPLIYQRHREHGYSAAYAKKYPERVRAYAKKYKASPKGRALIRIRDRKRQQNPTRRAYNTEKNRQWRKNNPERFREAVFQWKANRKARKAGAPVIERVYRSKIIKRDHSTCYICKQTVPEKEIHLDHVIPLCRGGEHSYANIRVTCKLCNLKKHSKLPEELGIVLDPLPPI